MEILRNLAEYIEHKTSYVPDIKIWLYGEGGEYFPDGKLFNIEFSEEECNLIEKIGLFTIEEALQVLNRTGLWRSYKSSHPDPDRGITEEDIIIEKQVKTLLNIKRGYKSQFIGHIDRVIFEDELDYEMAMEILLTIEHHFGECYSMLFVEWLRQKIKVTDDEINLRIADTFEKSSIEYKVGKKIYKEFFGETYFRVQKGNSYDTYANIYNRCYSNSHTI